MINRTEIKFELCEVMFFVGGGYPPSLKLWRDTSVFTAFRRDKGKFLEEESKMQIETKIKFHQENVVSVSFNCNATSKDEVKFSELLVFCVFSLRQLFNMGKHPCTVEIAELLNNMGSAGIKHGDITSLLENTVLVERNKYQ